MKMLDDLGLLDVAATLIGPIPDPIGDYLEWVLQNMEYNNPARVELVRILEEVTG